MEGLLKKNVIQYDNRPLWCDIYKRFKPVREPLFRTLAAEDELSAHKPPKILYYEDQIRSYVVLVSMIITFSFNLAFISPLM